MTESTRSEEPLRETVPLKVRIRQLAREVYAGQSERSAVSAWRTAEEQITRAHQDALVDEASEESFPASDSPAY